MRTIEEIKQDYIGHGICDGYLGMWDMTRSKRELLDIGSTMQGLGFLARGLSEGWGFTLEEIQSMFRYYINGRYVSNVDREPGSYDSMIWCGFSGVVHVSTTCAGMFGCDCTLDIKPWHVCYIFLDKSSRLDIQCPGTSRVMVENYGGKVSGTGRITVKDNMAGR